MYYVVLLENGTVTITQNTPLADDGLVKRVLPVEKFTDALAIQALAIEAKNTVVTDAIKNYRNDDIEAHKKVVAAKNERIQIAENECAVERTRTRERQATLRLVMNEIAVDMALERTHQQRNVAMRHIVKTIKGVLDSLPLDMDDIPF